MAEKFIDQLAKEIMTEEIIDQLETVRKEIENKNFSDASGQALVLAMALDASSGFKLMSKHFAQVFIDALDIISCKEEGDVYIPRGVLLLLKEEIKQEQASEIDSFRESMELFARSILCKQLIKEPT